MDKENIGEIEHLYSLCAKRCKIEMSETKWFPFQTYKGYFAIKRFDRDNKKGFIWFQ